MKLTAEQVRKFWVGSEWHSMMGTWTNGMIEATFEFAAAFANSIGLGTTEPEGALDSLSLYDLSDLYAEIARREAEPSTPAAAPERCPMCKQSRKNPGIVGIAGLDRIFCTDPWHAAAEQKYTQHSATCSYWASNVCNSGCAGHFQGRE